MEINKIKKEKSVVFLTGAILGILVFGLIYGFSVVNPANDSFIINGYIEKDVAQHYAGWMLFRTSEWTFPFGIGKNIAYPYGTAVSFTDSIPLLAIFFKIFRGILPETFQYFGLFVLICFALQGAFGGLLGYHFRKNILTSAAVSLVFVLSPVMIERAFRHCALTAHFLILAALYYYFENRETSGYRAYIPFIIINVLSITIHPYFMPFTFGIMFAFCLEKFFKKESRTSSVLSLLSSLVFTLIIGYIIGAFSGGMDFSAKGYGMFSANLNTFINPQSRGLSDWSAVIGLRPFYSDYQIEGFGYLGLGVLVFIPVSIIVFLFTQKKDIFKNIFAFIKNYFGIIFSSAALFIFAVGSTISYGLAKIFTIPWPDKLTDGLFAIFRANGRFIWIIVYLIVLFITYVLLSIKKEKPAVSPAILLILICIQFFDLSKVIDSKQSYFKGKDGDLQEQVLTSVLENPVWDSLTEKCDVCYLINHSYPKIGIDVAVKFAKAGKAVNTQFEARQNTEKYLEMKEDVYSRIHDGSFGEREILITSKIPQDVAADIINNGYCVYFTDYTYIICKDLFTENELNEFINYGGFELTDVSQFIE